MVVKLKMLVVLLGFISVANFSFAGEPYPDNRVSILPIDEINSIPQNKDGLNLVLEENSSISFPVQGSYNREQVAEENKKTEKKTTVPAKKIEGGQTSITTTELVPNYYEIYSNKKVLANSSPSSSPEEYHEDGTPIESYTLQGAYGFVPQYQQTQNPESVSESQNGEIRRWQSLDEMLACKATNCEKAGKITIRSSGITLDTNGFTMSSEDSNNLKNISIDVNLGDTIARIEKSVEKNEIRVTSKDVVATTSGEVEISQDYLRIDGKLIQIAPNTATENAIKATGAQSIESVQIDAKEKPMYIVEGKQIRKILGIIQVEMNTVAKIDVQTGEIVSVEKPWWSFLVG